MHLFKITILIAAALMLAGCAVKSQKQKTEQMAFSACHDALSSAAKNPTSAVIPQVKPAMVDGEYHYIWQRGDGLQFENGYGGMIDEEAWCNVYHGRVVFLQVGETHYKQYR